MKRKRSAAHRILIKELPPEEEGVLRLSWKLWKLEKLLRPASSLRAPRDCAICDDCVFRNAPSQQEGDRGGRWQQQRRSHLSTVKLWYSFSFTVATDHVWIDLCPVPAIEILIFNYQKCFQNGSDIIRWAHTAWCALPQSREGTLRFTTHSLAKYL